MLYLEDLSKDLQFIYIFLILNLSDLWLFFCGHYVARTEIWKILRTLKKVSRNPCCMLCSELTSELNWISSKVLKKRGRWIPIGYFHFSLQKRQMGRKREEKKAANRPVRKSVRKHSFFPAITRSSSASWTSFSSLYVKRLRLATDDDLGMKCDTLLILEGDKIDKRERHFGSRTRAHPKESRLHGRWWFFRSLLRVWTLPRFPSAYVGV